MENLGNEPTKGQTGTASPAEKLFTKDEVNKLMQKRVERSHQAFFNRYGVKDLDELDALLGKSQQLDETTEKLTDSENRYNELQTKYGDLENQHKDLTKRYAYSKGNINPERYSDIETYFKGKNLEINEDTLTQELKTHKDWANKPVTITSIGAENAQTPEVNEAELASRYFGVDLTK